MTRRRVLLTDVPDRCWLEYYLARWESAALGEAAIASMADSEPDAVFYMLSVRHDATERGDELLKAGLCGVPPS
jgi:hypothetical protein